MAHAPFNPRYVILFVPVLFATSARGGERDATGAALTKARQNYEKAMESMREDVFKKIDKETKRRTASGDLAGIDALKQARTAFCQSGAWPNVENIADCQNRARKAAQQLEAAYDKAQREYTKAACIESARAVQAERERFSIESDVAPWGAELITSSAPQIQSTRQAFDLGEPPSQGYRLKIVGRRVEGDGPLSCAIPLPGKKRVEIKTLPEGDDDFCALLSIRESLVSADLGAPRPVAGELKEDENPGKLEIWSEQGKFEITSIQLKPIGAAAEQTAQANQTGGGHAQGTPGAKVDPAIQLTEKSNWQGYRWHGQNPSQLEGPRRTNAKVVKRSGNQFELKTDRWVGGGGSLIWVLSIHGTSVNVNEVHVVGGEGVISEVQGGGTISGNVLQFESKSRYTGNGKSYYAWNRFELELAP